MIEAGHVWFGVGVSRYLNRTHVARPLPDNERGSSPAGAAALGSLRSPSLRRSRRGAERHRLQSNLQKDFYTPAQSVVFAWLTASPPGWRGAAKWLNAHSPTIPRHLARLGRARLRFIQPQPSDSERFARRWESVPQRAAEIRLGGCSSRKAWAARP